MASTEILKYESYNVYAVIGRTLCAVSLEDIAHVLGFDSAAPLMPVLAGFALDADVYEVPQMPDGTVQMITVPATLELLDVLGTPVAKRFAPWLRDRIQTACGSATCTQTPADTDATKWTAQCIDAVRRKPDGER